MTDLTRLSTAAGNALAAGGTVLLLSDFDGTLSPIVDRPGDAVLGREVRGALATLAAGPHVRVGIVSGRALGDLRSRVKLGDVIYAGCHGLEIEGPGIAFTHPDAEARRRDLASLTRVLQRGVGLTAGVHLEPKGLCVAVHYRRVAEAEQDRVRARVVEVLASWPGLLPLHGKKVVEILPAVDWSKGHCVTYLRDHVRSVAVGDVTTIYLGDDTTDERACAMLDAEVLTVRVGDDGGPTAARFRLADVGEVHRLLGALAESVRSRRPECA